MMLAVLVVAAVFVPLPANGATEPQIEPYKLAPLENRGWPPPAKWLRFVRPGECLAVRLPDEQSIYCPPQDARIVGDGQETPQP
jgi:hypothetical protein